TEAVHFQAWDDSQGLVPTCAGRNTAAPYSVPPSPELGDGMSTAESPPAYRATSSARRIALAESLDFKARALGFTSGRAGFTSTPRRFACFNNFKAAAIRLRASSIIGSG